jgi:hypothetical protein
VNGKTFLVDSDWEERMAAGYNRLIVERPLPDPADSPSRPANRKVKRAARSVVVNLAESPLGWLKARGHVSERQFQAGEQLREDWERAQLGPRVTMAWDAPPADKASRGAPTGLDPGLAHLAAKRRFDEAIAAIGPGLSDIAWRLVCAGEGMRDAEQALGWPARAGKLVLGLALDRLADHYRMR